MHEYTYILSAHQLDLTKTTKIKQFSDQIVKVEDGTLAEPYDGLVKINIPPKFLIMEFEDLIQAIVNSTYPDLTINYVNDNYLHSRAILATKIDIVNEINEYVLSLTPSIS